MFNYTPHDAEKHGSDCFAVGKHSDYEPTFWAGAVLRQNGQSQTSGSRDGGSLPLHGGQD